MWYMYEPGSKDWYDDEDEAGSADTATGCSDTILAPLYLLGGILLLYLAPVLLLLSDRIWRHDDLHGREDEDYEHETVTPGPCHGGDVDRRSRGLRVSLPADSPVAIPQSPAPVSAPARPTASTAHHQTDGCQPTDADQHSRAFDHTTNCRGADTFPSTDADPRPAADQHRGGRFQPTTLPGTSHLFLQPPRRRSRGRQQ